MKVTDTKFVQDYIAMAMHGDALGWHERNGGNFTYWLQDDEVRSIKEELTVSNEWLAIGTSVPYLANQYFLISGTGQFFHNMQKDPTHTIGIIQIDETGEKYQILWGLEAGGKPTSELPTHLMNMEVKAKQTKDANRVIYHCHCPNIIALTFILPLESEVFTRELWEIMTECPVIFPEGVGVVEWMVPGGKQIAIKTSQEMKEHGYNAVIWAHHGMFCSGTDFDQTFGLMHTIEKAAEIWLKVHSVVKVPRQSIPLQGLKDVGQAFGVKLNDSALYEK
ncbi:rhamnulose-1-phosphate aldolase [Absicoccus porci]|jgi:rhamnulose-1-phosphate aldolase|uniref:Rhamnulose-1-phosphate aldolase n=1 Tax=Absicoccus porci TaxID=2486576 RepID=A0A3N0I0C0_9FIRM|nr:rhamnulose-1-phosphate aldolase [Absicoccus porci]MDD6460140.1 rhamnulose-1-phosphate aldolase [Absicoccus porci]RNM30471.1 rhamnulose-1-phosphate aldolase [Absicoccus porci]